jgi:hypothetical protein
LVFDVDGKGKVFHVLGQGLQFCRNGSAHGALRGAEFNVHGGGAEVGHKSGDALG